MGAIPLLARVVSIADAFDAMTSVRPYRAALPLQEALAEIGRCRGVQFDPDVVEAFHRAYPDLHGLPIETPEKVQRKLPEGVAAGTASSPK